MKRRDFMRQAGGATAALGAGATATAGTAAAQDGGGQEPDFDGYTDGAEGGSYEDLRGESEVTIEVGAGSGELAFAPTEAWIDTGTTVTFEWVSDGHNVLFDDNPGEVSGHEPLEDSGYTFDVTFEDGGIYTYYCDPHRSLGMVGGIAVGEDVPTVSTGGGGRKELHDLGVAIQAHWVGAATILGIVMSVIFTFYLVKYGESAHTGTGR